MPEPLQLIITCEHASNYVPPRYHKFIPPAVLNSHRGLDFGAEEFAKKLSRKFGGRLFSAKTSRLLVDLNRSQHNRKSLFSSFLKKLSSEEKNHILMQNYFPYRNTVEKHIERLFSKKYRVLHISVHSFTPILNQKKRTTDIGILFDPASAQENKFAKAIRTSFRQLKTKYKLRFNYPYKGTSDGFVTYLRRKFKVRDYIGIEFEMNQKYPLKQRKEWAALQKYLMQALPF